MLAVTCASGMQHTEDFGSGSTEIGIHSCFIRRRDYHPQAHFLHWWMETIVRFIGMLVTVDMHPACHPAREIPTPPLLPSSFKSRV